MWIYWYSETLYGISYWYSDILHTGDACALSPGHGVSIWFCHPKECEYIDIPIPYMICYIDILTLYKDAGLCVSIWFCHPKECEYIHILKPYRIHHSSILTPYIQAMPAHCRFAKTQHTVFLFDSDTRQYVNILIFRYPT